MEARVAMRVWRRAAGCIAGAAALLWGEGQGCAQGSTETSSRAIAAEVRSLAGHAGTIFVGQITSVRRQGGVVEVSFRVEQPVRGAAGPAYVMREWAGLWPPGHSRYTVGQRVLAFVHGASATGFSSPVHGAEGLVPVVVQGAHSPQLLDIRRVAASVVRAPGDPLPTDKEGAVQLSDVMEMIASPEASGGAVPPRWRIPLRARPPVAFRPAVPAGSPASEPVEAPVHGAVREPVREQVHGPRLFSPVSAALHPEAGDARR